MEGKAKVLRRAGTQASPVTSEAGTKEQSFPSPAVRMNQSAISVSTHLNSVASYEDRVSDWTDSQTWPLAMRGPLMESPRLALMRGRGFSGQVGVIAKRGNRYQASKDETATPYPPPAAKASMISRATGRAEKDCILCIQQGQEEMAEGVPSQPRRNKVFLVFKTGTPAPGTLSLDPIFLIASGPLFYLRKYKCQIGSMKELSQTLTFPL